MPAESARGVVNKHLKFKSDFTSNNASVGNICYLCWRTNKNPRTEKVQLETGRVIDVHHYDTAAHFVAHSFDCR